MTGTFNAGKTLKILTDYQFNKVLYAGCAVVFIFLIVDLAFSPKIFFFAVLPVLSVFLTSVILFVRIEPIWIFLQMH